MVAHLEPEGCRNLGAGGTGWIDPPWFLPIECHSQPDASFAHHHVLKGTGHAADEVLDQPGAFPPCALGLPHEEQNVGHLRRPAC